MTMNGPRNDIDFQAYKKLTEEERDYFVFDNLCKISKLCDQLDALDGKYANKWVETTMKWAGYLTGASVITALLGLIISNSNNLPKQ